MPRQGRSIAPDALMLGTDPAHPDHPDYEAHLNALAAGIIQARRTGDAPRYVHICYFIMARILTIGQDNSISSSICNSSTEYCHSGIPVGTVAGCVS